MLTNDVTSAGKRFDLDSASIRFTLACLRRAEINQAKQQCRANTGRDDQQEACMVLSDHNDENILREMVDIRGEEGEDWRAEEEEWEEEEDSEWEEEDEDDDDEEEEEEDVWDAEKQAWADCLEQQGIPHAVYKPFLRAAHNLNEVIERLNGLNGCERLVQALRADQRRRFLLKVAAAHNVNIYIIMNLLVTACTALSCCMRPSVW